MSTTTKAAEAAAWAADEDMSPADRAMFGKAARPAQAPPPADQIPDDLAEHLAAVEHYRRAVTEIAKVDARMVQLEKVRKGLAAKVREAQQVMRDTDPSRRRRASGSAPGGRARSGSIRDRVLAALPGTTGEIAARAGLTGVQAGSALTQMLAEGRGVKREGERGSYVWSAA